ncbi:MAG: 2Fe-2S iron-sulfur cluster binding domain-containing protein [Novosphingobium sp.]|nr:2Fe-2S iron-sulfur cluster binding domain-containing protein [Novosphingobium sp.]
MVRITYVEHDGTRHEIDAPTGESMMKAAVNAGIEAIVAECGGNCACGTCRVYIAQEWREKLTPPQDTEREMIEYSEDSSPDVRLSCQIPVTEAIDGIEVTMPESQY